MEASGNAQGPPTPDPALRALDPFVGTWSMKGHLIGSDDENIVGQSTFRWLDGASSCCRTSSWTSRACSR